MSYPGRRGGVDCATAAAGECGGGLGECAALVRVGEGADGEKAKFEVRDFTLAAPCGCHEAGDS